MCMGMACTTACTCNTIRFSQHHPLSLPTASLGLQKSKWVNHVKVCLRLSGQVGQKSRNKPCSPKWRVCCSAIQHDCVEPAACTKQNMPPDENTKAICVGRPVCTPRPFNLSALCPLAMIPKARGGTFVAFEANRGPC